MSGIYLPYQKPPRWNISRAAVAYNCARMGLPVPKVAHWMCEGSGVKAYDYSGNGNDLELKNQAYWESTKIVGDTTDDYAIAPCDLYTTGQYTNFTWLFLYECTSLVGGVNTGIAQLANALTSISPFCLINRNSSGDLSFYANGGYRITLNSFLSVGEKYIITVTNKNGDWCLYINGLLKGTYGTGQSNESTATHCYINNGYNGYSGGKYEFNYIFPKTFIPTQVQTLYNNPYGMFEPIRSPATWAAPLGPTTAAPTLAPTTAPPADIRSAQVLAQVEWVEHVPTTAPPTTAAPTTPPPTTGAPTTAAPTTAAPTTAAPPPTTLASTTVAPTTPSPTTVAPTTSAPTAAPSTAPPTTLAPTTPVPPTTLAPTTPALTTLAPTTAVPETICIKELNSIITKEFLATSFIAKEILLKSVITKEIRFNGYLC